MSTLAAAPARPLYAGFWRRGAAAFVDGLVLFIPNWAIGYVIGAGFLGTLAQLAMNLAYYAFMHSSASQATLGKQVFHIKVTDDRGERIGIGRAVGRYFGLVLSSIILCIGLLMAAFTDRKRALHDMLCSTLVVNDEAPPEEIAAGGGTMPVTLGVVVIGFLLAVIPVAGIVAAIAIPMMLGGGRH